MATSKNYLRLSGLFLKSFLNSLMIFLYQAIPPVLYLSSYFGRGYSNPYTTTPKDQISIVMV